MSRRDRKRRKQELMTILQEQRLDVLACARDWLVSTTRYDNAWFALVKNKSLIMLGVGILSIGLLRRPKKMGRYAKRAIGLWSSWRVIRNFIKK